MHNAPPVVYPVGRFVWGGWVLAVWALSGALALFFWQRQSQAGLHLVAGAGGFWCLCVMASRALWKRDSMMPGCLVWNGETWFWRDLQSRHCEVDLQVLADWGTGLWITCRKLTPLSRSKRCFVWVHRRETPQLWHGFRCAVYSRQIHKRAKPNSGDLGG